MRRIAVLVLVVAAATACAPGRPATGSRCADVAPPAVAESPAPVPASLHYRHPIDPRIIDGPLYEPFQALGLTRAQAADRLSLQADGPDLIAWLITSVPDEYAGTALDNAAGMVDIYVTRPEVLAPLLAGYVNRDRVRVVEVDWSKRRLDAVGRCLAPILAAAGSNGGAADDITGNRLRIEFDDTAAGHAAAAGPPVADEINANSTKITVAFVPPAEPKDG